MIVVLVKYECKENCAKKFVEAIKELKVDECVRNETGNIRYDYSYPDNDANAVLLTELWESAEALAAHSAAPHMAKLAPVKAEYVNNTVVEKFEAVKL